MPESDKIAGDISPKKNKKSKKKIIFVVLGAVLIVLIFTLVIFGVGIYKYNWRNRVTEVVVSIIPYPAAIVNSVHFVTVKEFTDELKSIEKYYKEIQGIDFTQEENKNKFREKQKEILDLLIENEIVKEQAKKYKLKITTSEVEEEYKRIVEISGGEEQFPQTLKTYYNWTPEEFKQRVKILLLKKKLKEAVAKDDEINKTAKEKAEGILKDLRGGADFVELAKNFSDDGSAINGGDLGFFPRGSGLSSEVEDATFALEEGQISDIVKDKQGYNIIKLEDKKDDQVHIRLILIHPVDFQKWLNEKINEAKILRFLAK